MSRSCLSLSAQTPILLDKDQHLTKLIVMDAHRRVIYNGVKETLAELRSAYWLVKGRQFVRKLIHSCITCQKLEGRPFRGNPPPPLRPSLDPYHTVLPTTNHPHTMRAPHALPQSALLHTRVAT